MQGPARRSELRRVVRFKETGEPVFSHQAVRSTAAVRTRISRLRDAGWDIVCDQKSDGDPKYQLLHASSSTPLAQEPNQ